MSYSNYRRPEKKFTSTFIDKDKDFSKKETNIKSFESMKEDWKAFCSYYREYPDYFIDLISPPNCKIELYLYQRMMLRILFRYQNVYFTMTRGTAKSYTQVLALMLKCIMFPSIKLFLCAPTAKQASKITQQNVEAILNHFPLLEGEIEKKEFQKDYTRLIFKNKAQLEVIQVAQSSRGSRAHGGAIEEIVDEHMKKDVLNEVIIPTMADDRRVGTFGVDKSEIRKSTAIVTTCGTRQSFAYEKLMEVAGEMARGENSFIMGCGYELPVMHDQLDIDFIESIQKKSTFNKLSFSREYQSVWTGSGANSLVRFEDLEKCRILEKAEFKNTDKKAMYILSYDVARSQGIANAQSALAVIKCIERGDGTYTKHVVNVFSFEGTHFLEQAKFLKKKVNEFKATMLVVDNNGLGKGLVDQLVLEIDDNPSYSVVNDNRYDSYKMANSIPMIYALDSGSKEDKASDIHNLFINSVENNTVKLLVSESRIKSLEEEDSKTTEEDIIPFIMTDLLVDEVMNLERKQTGNDISVKRISSGIPKDKFSAVEYGIWYVHGLERKNRMRKKQTFSASNMFMMKPPSPY